MNVVHHDLTHTNELELRNDSDDITWTHMYPLSLVVLCFFRIQDRDRANTECVLHLKMLFVSNLQQEYGDMLFLAIATSMLKWVRKAVPLKQGLIPHVSFDSYAVNSWFYVMLLVYRRIL